MSGDRNVYRDTVVVFVCTARTSNQNGMSSKRNCVARRASSEHEKTPGNVDCGIELKLFPPKSSNIIKLYSTGDTEFPNNHLIWQNITKKKSDG